MLELISLTCLWLAASASAECSRALLKNATEQYVSAQSSGQIDVFTALASNLTYTENEKPLDIKTGVLSQPIKLDQNLSIHDPTLCATFTQLIAASAEHPYVIGTRMLLTGDKVTTIESIVTDEGDWLFNATGYLHWASQENWDPIPEDKRDSREVIQAAGDAYFNRFQSVNVSVPFGTPCARLEGGAYTDTSGAGGNTCSLGLPSDLTVSNRRYVVDEEMGVVDIYLGFPGLDRTVVEQAMPDSHAFRVEGGKIRYIHTVSSCVNAGCGSNFTIIPTRYRRVRRLSKLY
ncbi:uncharacterized protein GGS22DRAFT_8993 [Annulohypoxylon maeteangense]|uniref:uncharacterized protein n=1 Tax=Annulohypoxylon maeteangense TaxID=1927788 RepID=UPI0020072C6B|nr:uncharacterized protein GGS22DRAFT_8993 [Annulohypoxylon maeteangense]KAI0890147.1 hypothetical protein GGS22DRAFT_8993 [Annulohypoxylon maeteangense]